MIDWLIYALVLVALLQPTVARVQAALAFALLTLAHDVSLTDVPGYGYYILAAVTDVVIIAILSSLPKITKLSIRLIQISILSIVVNMVGFVFYMLYLPPFGYDLTFFAVYTLAITAMLGNDDVGGYSVDRRHPGIHRPTRAGGLSFNKGRKAL